MSSDRWYRGWLITRTAGGWWNATNYSEGYGRLMADTLTGIKLIIRETMEGSR